MSGGRADDLVVAGMRPQSFGTTSSPFDPIHRGTTLILFIDSLILLFVMYSVAAFFFPSLLEASLGFGAALLTMNWLAYRRKSRLAYWVAPTIIGFAAIFFLWEGMWMFYRGQYIFGFLMMWACFGSFRRVTTHFHPGYKSAYHNTTEIIPELPLEPGEMYAACPTCLAVLAIRPAMLHSSDRCPHCQSPLVSDELASKYEQE
jgi:hypothetical protein|tara:strand:+ start:255 stop:863 length:609 start_codon:yes stop_codon:yes gene_type:complete